MGGVTDSLTPEGRRFLKELRELAKLEVRVGYQRGKKSHTPSGPEGKSVDMCDIAAWNELGTDTIPSRPFLRDSVDKHKSELSAFKQKQFKRISNGETAEAVLRAVGAYQVGVVQNQRFRSEIIYDPKKGIRSSAHRHRTDESIRPLLDCEERESVIWERLGYSKSGM